MDPRAVAGYWILKNNNEIKIFQPPKERFYDNNEIINYLQSAPFEKYTIQNNRLISENSKPISRSIEYLLVNVPDNPKYQYIEIKSGKWVRGSVDLKTYYIDRDINAALNLARYNNQIWPYLKEKLFDYRIKNNIKIIKSNKNLKNVQQQIDKMNERARNNKLYKLELYDILITKIPKLQSKGPP